ncbi:hypothetical protein SAMN02745164_00681 [Marinitoga hydrogenitolerans DSM 16785]|uniref:Uncharacterized protein n=1 Tax=Marinitoga hydrogenitolerans (strain DSM 16785 / JCM 12826 / AT1271) TaxID=1122195 RepID=A0A1M4UHT9_MARH1|nr:hypothetical protein [Marinitoga hydrogenitolerans]SHE56331.1 hypothetical protein SAMN02745164_00681 [Marinitoga hydrogenitolerans DSM 16785]
MKKTFMIVLVFLFVITAFSSFYVRPFFNTVKENGQDYLTYSITGVFENQNFGIGLGLNAYQTEIGGPLYYGKPGMEETTDVLSGLTINLLKLRVGPLYFRYGMSFPKTVGLGMLMYNYTNNFQNALDLGIISSAANIEIHVPYSLDSLMPFTYNQTAFLYYGILKTRLGFINIETLAGKTMKKNEVEPLRDDLLGSVSAYLGGGVLKLGGEIGYINSTFDSTTLTGYGAGVGGILNLGVLTIKALPVVLQMPYYKLGFVNANYENNLEDTNNYNELLSYSDTRLGGIGELQLTLGNLLKANARLNYDLTTDFEILNPELNGSLQAKIPSEQFPLIIVGKYYKPMKNLDELSSLLDENTSAELSIGYPISNGLFMLYTKYYDNASDEFKDKIEFSVIADF